VEISHKLPPLEHAATSIVPLLQLETESDILIKGTGKKEKAIAPSADADTH